MQVFIIAKFISSQQRKDVKAHFIIYMYSTGGENQEICKKKIFELRSRYCLVVNNTD
jgi:hypothetical protein